MESYDVNDIAYDFATELMNWTFKYDKDDYYQNENFNYVMDVTQWEPCKDIQQLWMVLENIRGTELGVLFSANMRKNEKDFVDVTAYDIASILFETMQDIQTKKEK